MNKWHKWLLVIILVIYLISISTIIWPDILTKLLELFRYYINLHISLRETTLLRYISLSIITLTSVILIFVIALPTQQQSVVLIKSAHGRCVVRQ